EAEELLVEADATSATLKLSEVQRLRAEAANAAEQAALAGTLRVGIQKLIDERPNPPGANLGLPEHAVHGAHRIVRNSQIQGLVTKLEKELKDLDKKTSQELLDIERDFYIADAWTEYVEPALEREPDSGPSGDNGEKNVASDDGRPTPKGFSP